MTTFASVMTEDEVDSLNAELPEACGQSVKVDVLYLKKFNTGDEFTTALR